MINIGSYLLASAYPATATVVGTAESICTINGQPCESTVSLGGLFAFFGIFTIFFMLIFVLIIVSMWRIYQKAGQPGWASIVPIYNYIVLLEMIGKPTWWILLLFIPFINVIFIIIIFHNLSKSFGQDIGFTLGLIFLPFIFYPILAFGNYSYLKPQTEGEFGMPIPPQTPTGGSF